MGLCAYMKFKTHLLVQIILFIILCLLLNFNSAIIIVLYHFIPSLDFFLKKINIHPEMHRQLFHNLFIVVLSSASLFVFSTTTIACLGTINLLLHLLMDIGGNGVALFFPLSNHRFGLSV